MPAVNANDKLLIMAQIESALAGVIDSIVGNIAALRAAGVAQEQLELRLRDDLKAGNGWVTPLTGSVQDQFKGLQQRHFVNSQEEFLRDATDDENPRLMWNAVLSNSCKGCINRHGEIKTLDEWKSLGLPGHGATVCRHNCKCTLLPLRNARRLYHGKTPEEIRDNARKVLVEKRKAILAEADARDKDFAPSTFNAKLGTARGDVSIADRLRGTVAGRNVFVSRPTEGRLGDVVTLE